MIITGPESVGIKDAYKRLCEIVAVHIAPMAREGNSVKRLRNAERLKRLLDVVIEGLDDDEQHIVITKGSET